MARQRNPADVKKAVMIADAAHSGDFPMLKYIGDSISSGKRGRISHLISQLCGKDGNGPLHYAAGLGYAEICEYLIGRLNIDVNMRATSGKRPICYAANYGNPSAIEYLIDHGANVNIKDDNGFTPLHDAVIGAKPQALEVLLSRGAKIDLENFIGSPLLLATLRGDISCGKVLLDHGADPNKVLCHVVTPLVLTVMNNIDKCLFHQGAEGNELVEILIQAGADVNMIPVLGLAYHSKELMDYLLKSGANPNLIDKSGMLPIEIAAMRGKKEIVETLFPLTTPIPAVSDWSIEGLFNYVESEGFKKERKALSKKRLVEMKKKIEVALSQKEYLAALVLCTYALEEDPDDASFYYAKRSRCWMQLGTAQCGVTSFMYKLNSAADAEKSKSPEDIYALAKDYSSKNDTLSAVIAFAAGLHLGSPSDSTNFKEEIKKVMDTAIESGEFVLKGDGEGTGDPEFTVLRVDEDGIIHPRAL